MADLTGLRRWQLRALFVLIGAVVYFVQLLPLKTGPGTWPWPDLVLLVGLCWVLRRSEVMPLWLFTIMVLLGDILLMRPLGLWAAASVIALEFLRTREPTSRDMPLGVEWAMVAAVLVLMYLGTVLTLVIFVANRPPLNLLAIEFLMTVFAYPLVVLATRHGLRLRKIGRGQYSASGSRV